mgnify:CR=1 FL=1
MANVIDRGSLKSTTQSGVDSQGRGGMHRGNTAHTGTSQSNQRPAAIPLPGRGGRKP